VRGAAVAVLVTVAGAFTGTAIVLRAVGNVIDRAVAWG